VTHTNFAKVLQMNTPFVQQNVFLSRSKHPSRFESQHDEAAILTWQHSWHHTGPTRLA